MSHIFVSYSRKNLTFVTQLVTDLQQADLPVWFDQISIQPGENWEAAIEKGLKEAIAVAVVVSPDSMASEYVRKEINFAQESDQLILPVLYRPAQLFLNLQTIQWVDLSSEAVYAANLQKLIAVLRREPGLLENDAVPTGEAVEVDDTRKLSPTILSNYLHIGAMIAGQTKSQQLWRRLAGSIGTASQMNVGGQALALSRLTPPTLSRLVSLLGATPSIQILHLICRTENDMCFVEDDQGRETPLQIDELARILQNSSVKLLVVQGQLSVAGIQKLMQQSLVQAVITTTTAASDVMSKLFEEHFYAALAAGKAVQVAYQTALNTLGPDDKDHFKLTAKHDGVMLDYPPIEKRPIQPIIDPGLPPMRNVPINPDFVGQGQPLLELSEKLSSDDTRQVMIYGLGGMGKSWLASEFVARYGWRFSDGIVWIQVSEQTRAEDIFNQLRLLLGLPLNSALTHLENTLRQRRVLIVLDQANEWGNSTELTELAQFVSRLEPLGGTRVMLTAWGPTVGLAEISGSRELTLAEMLPVEAEELVRQLIIDYDVAGEFKSELVMRQLIEKTAYTPWFIKEGVRLTRLEGLEVALEDLDALSADTMLLFERYVGMQHQKLAEPTQVFLRQLQGLPDSFDRRLVQAIDSQSREHLRQLIQHQLLRREDKLYTIPPTVRVYLRQRYPLSEAEQDTIDQQVIQYWLGGAK
ncbi:MAG: TIR domain-containing protein [Chloroflexi bacterium]|nr:TIR domain-containing protein [Chloroflexota bacterium]